MASPVQQEQIYGALFENHLTTLGRQTPCSYKDLQQIKAMTQTDLADPLKVECREFSQFVLCNTPEVAAELFHQRRTEMAAASANFPAARRAATLIELIVQLFAITH